MARSIKKGPFVDAHLMKKAGRAGRKSELSEADRKRLEQLLVQGPEKLG